MLCLIEGFSFGGRRHKGGGTFSSDERGRNFFWSPNTITMDYLYISVARHCQGPQGSALRGEYCHVEFR